MDKKHLEQVELVRRCEQLYKVISIPRTAFPKRNIYIHGLPDSLSSSSLHNENSFSKPDHCFRSRNGI